MHEVDGAAPEHVPRLARPEMDVGTHEVWPDLAYLDQSFRLGDGLEDDIEAAIVDVLREYLDVFAWSASDLKGVDRSIVEYHLHVHPGAQPVR